MTRPVPSIVCALAFVTLAPGCTADQRSTSPDRRAPVALEPAVVWTRKQMMMEFLEAMQRIQSGLARADWDAVTRAAEVLGTTPERRPECVDRSSGTHALEALALDFRCRADAITVAAQQRDRDATLRATADTLSACNGCHRAFRFRETAPIR